MKYVFSYVLSVVLLTACGNRNDTVDHGQDERKQAQISSDTAHRSLPILLTETTIAGIPIPFEDAEMLEEISSAFAGYQVSKEVGQQDGPDFPIYSVNHNGEMILVFAMNWSDTSSLDAIYIKSTRVADVYGLTVGYTLQEITSKRTGELVTQRDDHGHWYAFVEGSRIVYEIEADEILPDTMETQTVLIPQNEQANWKIAQLIWRETQ